MPFIFNGKYYMLVRGGSQEYTTLLEKKSAGTYTFTVPDDCVTSITLVGGGGAAAMRGVYDDRGYGWTGGSGGAFVGLFKLKGGTYTVTVGSANNNTKGQGGNTNTMNPDDTSTHDSYIDGVVRVGGGGSGTTSGVGAAGASATFEVQPFQIIKNLTGNSGASGSGGKGSGANWTHNGGVSVYEGYGKGQGCSTSEYASRRYWINGTDGYVNIKTMSLEMFNTPLKYFTSPLVCENKTYRPLFETASAGTHSVEIPSDGFITFDLVGAGGGGACSSWSSGDGGGADGGSGGHSRFEEIPVKAGDVYQFVVGSGGGRALTYEWGHVRAGNGGDTYVTIGKKTYLAQGGVGGRAWGAGSSVGGAGGYGNVSYGKTGNRYSGYNVAGTDTASVYNGYGKGGAGAATNPGGGLTGWVHNGYSGYAKVSFRALTYIKEY